MIGGIVFTEMHSFFSSIFSIFLSPFGLVVLAALDSSMMFFLPAAVDMAVIILVARHDELVWLFPILAAAGSIAGVYVTFRIGAKIGENSLSYWISEHRLKSIQKRIKDTGAIALALSGLMPPPFPLTPFVLVCGALQVSRIKFFVVFGATRLFRFGLAAVLAALYGKRIIGIIESDLFQTVVAGFILIALLGTAYSVYCVVRSTRHHRRENVRLIGKPPGHAA